MKKIFSMIVSLSIAVLLASCMSSGNVIDLKTKIKNQNRIKIGIIFEENELGQMKDMNGRLLAYYDRIENKNYSVAGVKVYDVDEQILYTIIPVVAASGEIQIFVKDSSGQTAELDIKPKLGGFDTSLDFYKAPYKFNMYMFVSFGGGKMGYSVDYKRDTVMGFETEASFAGVKESSIVVDNSFLEMNENQAVLWAMCIKVLNEVMNNHPSRSGGMHDDNKLNFDGSKDWNQNPGDKF